MRAADDIYTLPISAATSAREESLNNNAAALPSGLSLFRSPGTPSPCSYDPATHTMSTLFAEKEAAQSATGQPSASASRMALVTWQQRDDPHWFGGRIPDKPISVEIVATGPRPIYQRFDNVMHHQPPASPEEAAKREAFILGLTTRNIAISFSNLPCLSNRSTTKKKVRNESFSRRGSSRVVPCSGPAFTDTHG